MEEIQVKDKTFKVFIPEKVILQHVCEVASRLSADYEGKNPLFLVVLNGSFMFAADLVRAMTIPCEISFVKLSSYAGTTSTGTVNEVIGINTDLKGRNVVIVEDIVESGRTLDSMKEMLSQYNPLSVKICTLFFKPQKLVVPLDVDYAAMEIGDEFIVGYGLDYDQAGRCLRDVYVISE